MVYLESTYRFKTLFLKKNIKEAYQIIHYEIVIVHLKYLI